MAKKFPFATINISQQLPRWLLIFIAGVYPLIVIPNKLSYFYAPRSFILLFTGLLTCYWLIRCKIKINKQIIIHLGVFWGFALLSAVSALDPAVGWFGNIYRYSGFAVYLACGTVLIMAYEKGNGIKILKAMTICAVLISAISIMQHFGFNIVPHEEYRAGMRSYGTLANPNFLGTYTVFILPVPILLYLREKHLKLLAAAALVYAGLLVSSTRGCWLAFPWLMGCIMLGEIKKDLHKWKHFLLVIFVLFSVTIIFSFTQGGILTNRLYTIPAEIEAAVNLEANAGSSRMGIWKQVIKVVQNNWAFGVGPDNLHNAGVHLPSTIVDKAHNIYLEMAATMGIPALLAWLALIWHGLRGWKSHEGFIYAVMISTYLVQGLFNIDVAMILPLFWMVLGLSYQTAADDHRTPGLY